MPLLGSRRAGTENKRPPSVARVPVPLFPECSNPACSSGRLHLWRHRSTPVFEGGWVCSPECMLSRIQQALGRELEGHGRPREAHRHRIPLGLILLEQGWITHAQLKQALAAKRRGEPYRIGAWLMRHCGLTEQRVTQALSLQWNCPVFTGEPDPALLALAPIPRILLDAWGVVPLRSGPSGLLYLAWEDRIDHALILAIERMTGRRVEAGLLGGSEFRRCRERVLAANFPRTRLLEAVSAEALGPSLARIVEKAQAAEARLVRVDRFFWLRLWQEPGGPSSAQGILSPSQLISYPAEDVVCSLAIAG